MKTDDTTATLVSKIHLALRQLPHLPRTFRIVWTAAKTWTIAWAAIMVVQGLLPASIALLARRFVNSLVLVLKAGGRSDAGPLLVVGGAIGLALLLSEVLSNAESWIRTAQAEFIQDHISELIHAQTIRLDLGFFESSEYYDQLHRARVDALSRPAAILENTSSLVKNSLTIAALGCVMATYTWWLPPALFPFLSSPGAAPGAFLNGENETR
jgi:ATP-binding cassette subfamily B protein